MRSKSVALLLADLGITKTHSRPYVSNDNPYSESQFKTMKYCPEFPSRFGCLEDGRLFCGGFFDYYNNAHRHSGLGLMTPAAVHYGRADELPWCTTPIEAESSLGPDSHHPIISLSGIPSAVMVLRILHPILASTLCAANPLARIAEPTIAL